MKKLTVLGAVLVLSMFFVGCAHKAVAVREGHGDKAGVFPEKRVPLKQANEQAGKEQAASPAPTADKFEQLAGLIAAGQKQMNEHFLKMFKFMSGDSSRAEPGPFARRAARNRSLEAPKSKSVSRAKPAKKTTKASSASRKEINALKDRVGYLEEVVSLGNKGVSADGINFDSGSSTLSAKSRIYLKDLAKQWFAGKIDILAIKSYADSIKPIDPDMTNQQYADLRLNDTVRYLEAEGVQMEGVAMKSVGESDRFVENKKVTFTLRDVTEEAEIEKRKEERKQHKKPPMK